MNWIETATSEKKKAFIYASRGGIRGCAEGSQAFAIPGIAQELIFQHRMCCLFATVVSDKYTDQPQLLTLLCPVPMRSDTISQKNMWQAEEQKRRESQLRPLTDQGYLLVARSLMALDGNVSWKADFFDLDIRNVGGPYEKVLHNAKTLAHSGNTA